MKLHQLSPKRIRKPVRIGRGGKRGTTSGRGQKGQKSRAGRKMRPAMRDLLIRIPKHRGFRNKPTTTKPLVVSLSSLIKRIDGKASSVDRATLQKLGMIPKNATGTVKLLGKGELSQALSFKGISASKGVRHIIEKAGGKVE